MRTPSTHEDLEALMSLDDLNLSTIQHGMPYHELTSHQKNLYTAFKLIAMANIVSEVLNVYSNVLDDTGIAPTFFTFDVNGYNERDITLDNAYRNDGTHLTSLDGSNYIEIGYGLFVDDITDMLGDCNNTGQQFDISVEKAQNFFNTFFPNG